MTGNITPKGYRRIKRNGRLRMEHDLVWEGANGPIPPGHDVHHRDFDKLNNRLDNLQLLTKLAHKRLHSGCVEISGVEHKPCRKCGEFKPIAEYYQKPDGIMTKCKPCCVADAVANKKRRRAERLAA